MSTIQDALLKIGKIKGHLGSCIVDSDSGMMLAASEGSAFDLEIAAAGNTEVVRAKRQTMSSLQLQDRIEDILITLGKQYHLIRPLGTNAALFIYVVLDKENSNLAMARISLASAEKDLEIS